MAFRPFMGASDSANIYAGAMKGMAQANIEQRRRAEADRLFEAQRADAAQRQQMEQMQLRAQQSQAAAANSLGAARLTENARQFDVGAAARAEANAFNQGMARDQLGLSRDRFGLQQGAQAFGQAATLRGEDYRTGRDAVRDDQWGQGFDQTVEQNAFNRENATTRLEMAEDAAEATSAFRFGQQNAAIAAAEATAGYRNKTLAAQASATDFARKQAEATANQRRIDSLARTDRYKADDAYRNKVFKAGLNRGPKPVSQLDQIDYDQQIGDLVAAANGTPVKNQTEMGARIALQRLGLDINGRQLNQFDGTGVFPNEPYSPGAAPAPAAPAAGGGFLDSMTMGLYSRASPYIFGPDERPTYASDKGSSLKDLSKKDLAAAKAALYQRRDRY